MVRSLVELFAMMMFPFFKTVIVSCDAFTAQRFFLKNNSNYTVTAAYIQVVKYPIIIAQADVLYRIMHKLGNAIL